MGGVTLTESLLAQVVTLRVDADEAARHAKKVADSLAELQKRIEFALPRGE